MSATSNPFAINTSAPQPFVEPYDILTAQFYPQGVDWNTKVVPQLYLLSALYAFFTLVALGCIVTRWNRVPYRTFRMAGGFIMPNTVIWFAFFSMGWVILMQPQIWILVGIFKHQGSYKGLWIVRTLGWDFLGGLAWTQLHGVFLATSLNSRATSGKKRGDSHRPSIGSPFAWLTGERWEVTFNALSFFLPGGFFLVQLAVGAAAEGICEKQFDNFRDAQAIAKEGMRTGPTPDLIEGWYSNVEKVATSSCANLQKAQFILWAFWMGAMYVLAVTSYIILSRKLITQINLLRHSARTFARAENQEAVLQVGRGTERPETAGTATSPAPPFSPFANSKEAEAYGTGADGYAHSENHTSRPQRLSDQSATYRSYTDASVDNAPPPVVGAPPPAPGGRLTPNPLKKATIAAPPQHEQSQDPGMSDQVRYQLKRANGLEAGLRNLRWQNGLFTLALTVFLVHDFYTLHEFKRVQTDATISAIVNLLAIWIYPVIAGPALLLLFLIGLDPDRHSFLGISLKMVKPYEHNPSHLQPGDHRDLDEDLRMDNVTTTARKLEMDLERKGSDGSPNSGPGPNAAVPVPELMNSNTPAPRPAQYGSSYDGSPNAAANGLNQQNLHMHQHVRADSQQPLLVTGARPVAFNQRVESPPSFSDDGYATAQNNLVVYPTQPLEHQGHDQSASAAYSQDLYTNGQPDQYQPYQHQIPRVPAPQMPDTYYGQQPQQMQPYGALPQQFAPQPIVQDPQQFSQGSAGRRELPRLPQGQGEQQTPSPAGRSGAMGLYHPFVESRTPTSPPAPQGGRGTSSVGGRWR